MIQISLNCPIDVIVALVHAKRVLTSDLSAEDKMNELKNLLDEVALVLQNYEILS